MKKAGRRRWMHRDTRMEGERMIETHIRVGNVEPQRLSPNG